jgi:hypothetical protein
VEWLLLLHNGLRVVANAKRFSVSDYGDRLVACIGCRCDLMIDVIAPNGSTPRGCSGSARSIISSTRWRRVRIPERTCAGLGSLMNATSGVVRPISKKRQRAFSFKISGTAPQEGYLSLEMVPSEPPLWDCARHIARENAQRKNPARLPAIRMRAGVVHDICDKRFISGAHATKNPLDECDLLSIISSW